VVFSRLPSRPIEEFSLAELVAKISELEERQRNRASAGHQVPRGDDSRERSTALGLDAESELSE
jgi:hypothetical protein